MTQRTGANTYIGVTVNSIIDSSIAAGAGNKVLVNSLTHAKGTTELTTNPIGSGISMADSSAVGDIVPKLTINKNVDYDDMGIALLAQMLGTETCAAWAGGYSIHSLAFNETLNSNYACIGFHGFSAGVFEYPNTVVTGVTIEASPNKYLTATYDCLAGNELITGTTNTADSLQSTATLPTNHQVVIVRTTDYVRLNAQAGAALAAGDAIAVTKATIKLTREQEFVPEIRGASGLGAPRASGNPPWMADVTVTFKNLQDFTYFTARDAGTEYKMDLLVTSGTYKFQVNIPRCLIVSDPAYDLSNPAENESTVVFKSLAATTAPTGMFSTTPHITVINQSGAYLQ